MAKKFEEVGVDIVELNMCCPNMSFNFELSTGDANASAKKTGASLGQNADAVAEIVRAIKKEIKIPLFVKLTPEGGKIAQVAKALYNVECGMVIAATGQVPDANAVKEVETKYGMVVVDSKTGKTNVPGVYAGGDVETVKTVIVAIAAGNKAAAAIDSDLMGEMATIKYEPVTESVDPQDVLKRNAYFTDDEAQKEASRCLQCGCGEGCQLCKTICSEFAIYNPENDKIEMVDTGVEVK